MIYKAYFNWTEKMPGEPRLKTVLVDAKDLTEANAKVAAYLKDHYHTGFTQLSKIVPA